MQRRGHELGIRRPRFWSQDNCNTISQSVSQSVQLLSRVWLFATPWTAACHTSLSITNSQSLLKLMCIESVLPSNHLILCRPLLLLPSIFPSIKVFSEESALRIRWPKYWSFSFSISPSKAYSGLISFRMDWFDLFQSKGLSRVLSYTTFLGSSIKISFNKLMKRGNQLFTVLWKEIQKSYIKQLYVKNEKKNRLFLERFVQRLQAQTQWWNQYQVWGILPSDQRVLLYGTNPLFDCWLHC